MVGPRVGIVAWQRQAALGQDADRFPEAPCQAKKRDLRRHKAPPTVVWAISAPPHAPGSATSLVTVSMRRSVQCEIVEAKHDLHSNQARERVHCALVEPHRRPASSFGPRAWVFARAGIPTGASRFGRLGGASDGAGRGSLPARFFRARCHIAGRRPLPGLEGNDGNPPPGRLDEASDAEMPASP
jgi:hypothetical protein